MPLPSRRSFLEKALATVAAAPLIPGALSARETSKRGPSELIRVGVMGVRGRGRAHINAFKSSPDAKVVAICDPDEAVIAPAMKAVPEARYYKDIRKMLESDDIDAISIAAPNHWHSLATIWALQAGKHVYVEKPISHDIYEGRQVVAAAAKYGKVVQHGTQSRSSKATRDAIAWLHEGGLGKIELAHGLCYKRRGSIGKVDSAQRIPESMDFDLWTGPSKLEPLMRRQLHYDWHWLFNTGNGDMGNQGVHQMDIARWGLNKNHHPESVVSIGGRVGYDDDGDTPNSLLTLFDYGDQKLLFETRGLKTPSHMGVGIGVIFHCEKGYLVSASYESLEAFDLDGNEVRTFKGGGNHFQVFLDAVKANDPTAVNATALDGHLSAALCHLGNYSYLGGRPKKLAATESTFGGTEEIRKAWKGFGQHLAANEIPADALLSVGPRYQINAEKESLQLAGREVPLSLYQPNYRPPFEIPNLA